MKDKLISLWKSLSQADIRGSNELVIQKGGNQINVTLDYKTFEFKLKENSSEFVAEENKELVRLICLDENFYYYMSIRGFSKFGVQQLGFKETYITKEGVVIRPHHYVLREIKLNTRLYNFPFGNKPTHSYIEAYPAILKPQGYTLTFGEHIKVILTNEEGENLINETKTLESTAEQDIINKLIEIIK